MDGKYLTYNDRLKLEAYLEAKLSVSRIARLLGVCRKTVYNEIARGTVIQVDTNLKGYKKYYADAGERVTRGNQQNKGRYCKYAYDNQLMARLRDYLTAQKYSPKACAACMGCGICANTIYNYIRAGRLDGVKMSDLPCPRVKRYQRVKRTAKRNPYKKRVLTIEDRPQIINARAETGHFEIDTVYSGKGYGSACLLTLTDRASRFEIIRKMPDRKAESVRALLPSLIAQYGIKSITSDNGSEFQNMPDLIPWYYCHAYHSWERGTNENYNRMIRRWFPKDTDFSSVSDAAIKRVEDWINSYPIKISTVL